MLSPNQRAMTVKVDEASGVAGFLTPGSRVDVVVVVDKGEYDKDPRRQAPLPEPESFGHRSKTGNSPGRQTPDCAHGYAGSTPEQGERLALAAQEGRISLVLRGQGDQQLVETLGADASELFGRPRQPTPPAPPVAATVSPAARTVEMIRGLERAPVNPW